MKKISVIVPVWNVEKYISKCLDSIVNSTLEEIEIIIVNDGSPDHSKDIIDSYQKKYPKIIRSYEKENGGLSSARNYGIKKSNGEYISFVDGDDYIDSNMLKLMYDKAKENDYDVVACDVRYIYDNRRKNVSCNIKKDIIGLKELKDNMINIYPTACNKIYKRAIFEKVSFKNKIYFEDVEFLYRLFLHINSIGVVKMPLYNYLQRGNAITSTFDERIMDYIDNWNGVIDYYKNENKYHEYKEELEYCYVRYLYATIIKGLLHYNNYRKYLSYVNVCIENVESKFPNYKKNKYFYKSIKGLYLLTFNKTMAKLMYKLSKK